MLGIKLAFLNQPSPRLLLDPLQRIVLLFKSEDRIDFPASAFIQTGGARCAALLAQRHRSRVFALFLGRRIAVWLLARRYIDNRFSELVGVSP